VKLYQYGFFEEGLTRAIIEKLRPGDTFVDIGAHVGYYTILASLLVGAEGHVVAFEPTPRTAPSHAIPLRKNYAALCPRGGRFGSCFCHGNHHATRATHGGCPSPSAPR